MSYSVEEDEGLSICLSNSTPGSPCERDVPADLPLPTARKSSASMLSRLLFRLRGRKSPHLDEISIQGDTAGVVRRYTYNELRRATGGFSDDRIIGRGGTGTVYRGLLSSDNELMDVAVKKFHIIYNAPESSYATEIKILSSLHHHNIVKLLGWCHDADRLLIVYEFTPNGSLYSHLHSELPRKSLPWEIRYSRIAKGLASALLYLQTGWERCIIHRDIKSSNVLLDQDFNPKLADFELAQLDEYSHAGEDHQTSTVIGTFGYMAPEYLTMGWCGTASDIYSFGVVALEIASGRKAVENPLRDDFVLVKWVRELHERGVILEAADPRLDGVFDRSEMERLLLVGLCCTQDSHRLRPSISMILQLLAFESPMPMDPYILSDNSQTICFELKDIDIGTPSSQSIARTFNIGIPPGYREGPVKEHHHPIMSGVVSSLHKLLKHSNESLCFEEVLESIRKYTAFLVSIGAPVQEWDSLAQIVLRTLDETPRFFDSANSGATLVDALSCLDVDIQKHSQNICKDTSKLETINKHLICARDEHDSLMAMILDIQKLINEEAENVYKLAEEAMKLVNQRKAQQQLFLEQKKRQYSDIQSLQKFLFEMQKSP